VVVQAQLLQAEVRAQIQFLVQTHLLVVDLVLEQIQGAMVLAVVMVVQVVVLRDLILAVQEIHLQLHHHKVTMAVKAGMTEFQYLVAVAVAVPAL
jgi:hypothetical protein